MERGIAGVVRSGFGGASRRLLLLAFVAGALAGLALPATAAAEYRHLPAAQFGPDGSDATSFGNLNSLAYQQATHHLYALDAEGKIYGFEHGAPGAFTPLGGSYPIALGSSFNLDSDLAVDNSSGSTAGNLYLTKDQSTFSSFDPSGSPLLTTYQGGGEICGLAVDNAGHIWAGRYSPNAALEFEPEVASSVMAVDLTGGATNPCKIAVDQSNNDLYVSQWGGGGAVWQYTASSGYTVAKNIAGGSNNRLAVNGAKHVLYVGGPGSGGIVRAYDTVTGNLVETIEAGGAVRGLAVDESSDALFVALGSGINKVLEMQGAQVPKVETGEPLVGAQVSGSVDPEGTGSITECFFEFGTTSYESQEPCEQPLPIGGPTTVTATLPGLARETTYRYRLVVGNASVSGVNGQGRTITLHNVQQLETEAASEVSRVNARLNASFLGNGEETTYFFEYGTSLSYGSRYPLAGEEAVAASNQSEPLSASIAGLTPGTTYHVRVVAKNGLGVSHGGDVAFETAPAVAGVVAEPLASADVTKTTATLRGSYDGANPEPPGPTEDVHYYFEWGPNQFYGHVTAAPPGVDSGTHAEVVHVSAPVANLAPHTSTSSPYHFRLVASNSLGTTRSADMTFSTLPPDRPQVSEIRAESIQPTSAVVAASLNPGAAAGSYVINYGTTTHYGRTTLAADFPAEDGNLPISVPLENLEPATIYYYRVVATNDSGASDGEQHTFVTPAAPAIDLAEISTGTDSAHLTVLVTANARPTEFHVEYGESAAYGNATPPTAVAPSLEPQTFELDLHGLRPETTYHVRAVATNEAGTTTGEEHTFVTQHGPPQSVAPPPEAAAPVPCRRGFVQRRGRCARKHPHRHGKRKHKHKKKRHRGGRRKARF